MASDLEGGLLGRLAVHYKLITMQQLDAVTHLQLREPGKKLGELLVEQGLITPKQLLQLLAAQQQYLAQLEKKRQSTKPVPVEAVKPPSAVPAAQPATPPAAAAGVEFRSTPPTAADPAAPASRPGETDPEPYDPTMIDLAAQQPPPAQERPAEPVDPYAHGMIDLDAKAAEPQVAAPVAAPTPRPAPAPAPTAPAAPAQVEVEAEAVERPAPNPQAVAWLNGVLERAAKVSASDIHIHPGSTIKLRRFCKLVKFSDQLLPPQQAEAVLTSALDDRQYRRFADAGEVDFAYSVPNVGRFRANVYREHRGVNGVFHFIPARPPTFEDLGLPRSLAKVTNYFQGLILVTGPAGCGKSSTLAALVNILNEEREDHILTIEDPIEYIHPAKRCVVNQRQVQSHTESFARALRAALREDPDVICIGELRDLETISLALSAAETGHLVIATLHTNNAIRTINRIVGAYPPAQQSQVRTMLSESLRAVISQRLLPTVDREGVALALEILHVNKAVGNLIRENRTFQIHSILQTGAAHGMQLLDISLAQLVKTGRISKETAALNSDSPQQFR